MPKYVYRFSEGDMGQKDLLGGKGANLAEMARIGLPVPPGFTITTEACRAFMRDGDVPPELRVEVTMALREIEDTLGRRLGDFHEPLLVSVRSGAKFSMPGMMETVLNVGLNDASVKGLAEFSGDDRFAWDSYRRLIQMFGKTVLDIEGDSFAHALDEKKRLVGAASDVDLTADDLQDLVTTFKAIVLDATGREFPQEPREQLDLTGAMNPTMALRKEAHEMDETVRDVAREESVRAIVEDYNRRVKLDRLRPAIGKQMPPIAKVLDVEEVVAVWREHRRHVEAQARLRSEAERRAREQAEAERRAGVWWRRLLRTYRG